MLISVAPLTIDSINESTSVFLTVCINKTHLFFDWLQCRPPFHVEFFGWGLTTFVWGGARLNPLGFGQSISWTVAGLKLQNCESISVVRNSGLIHASLDKSAWLLVTKCEKKCHLGFLGSVPPAFMTPLVTPVIDSLRDEVLFELYGPERFAPLVS